MLFLGTLLHLFTHLFQGKTWLWGGATEQRPALNNLKIQAVIMNQTCKLKQKYFEYIRKKELRKKLELRHNEKWTDVFFVIMIILVWSKSGAENIWAAFWTSTKPPTVYKP